MSLCKTRRLFFISQPRCNIFSSLHSKKLTPVSILAAFVLHPWCSPPVLDRSLHPTWCSGTAGCTLAPWYCLAGHAVPHRLAVLKIMIPAFPVPLQKNSIHPVGSWEHPRHLLPGRLLNFPLSQKNKSCLQSQGGRGDKFCQRQACFSPSLYFDSCCR